MASLVLPAASYLKTTSGEVSIGGATAPSAGQVLTALGATSADWATPSGGSLQASYTAGGAGGGAITLTSSGGPLAITNPAATSQAALTVTQNTVASQMATFSGGSGITITQGVNTTGSPTALSVVGAAHTTLTLSTEATDIDLNLARTVQFATGALTTQRAMRLRNPTYAFVGASTITTAATLAIDGAPAAGTNATITNSFALLSSGNVGFNSTGATLAQAATAGFVYLPQCATGAPSGTPTSLLAGQVPFIVGGDNALYAYYGGAWHSMSGGGGGTSSLQAAYNGGATITTTASTPVAISNSAATTIAFTVTNTGGYPAANIIATPLVDGTIRGVLYVTDNTTAGAGVGGGIEFVANDTGTTSASGVAGINGIKENATAGNYAGALTLHTRLNGAVPAERVRITSAGSINLDGDATVDSLGVFRYSGAYVFKTGGSLIVANTSGTNYWTFTTTQFSASQNGANIQFQDSSSYIGWTSGCSLATNISASMLSICNSGNATGQGLGGLNAAYLKSNSNADLTLQAQGTGDLIEMTNGIHASYHRGASKSLTNNTAAQFMSVTTWNLATHGVALAYSVLGNDGTNSFCETGILHIAITQTNGGSLQYTLSTPTAANKATSGTLAVTFTATTGTNVLNLFVNGNSSLAGAGLIFRWSVIHATTLVTPV